MRCDLYSVPPDVMRRMMADPAQLHELLWGRGFESNIGLEKSWHGLHFTLSGSAWGGEPPLNFLLGGGEPIDDGQRGYGPALAFDPEQVARIDAALAAITLDEFARRFDVAKLAAEDIYPSIWDEPPDELLEEYGWYFEQAKAFIGEVRRRGTALLVDIS